MPSIDPIVPLSAGVATSPGAYAVLVGSGVSLEAHIPTGAQVLQITLERLYAASNPSAPTPSPSDLAEWARHESIDTMGYSEMLEQVFPAEQSRRDFLAGLFRGTAPGPSHHALAALAERGLVRVFITTNFDPHLEDALKLAGRQPIVVSDGPTLERAPARENSEVFVVKAHGDVGQVNIRNTLSELDRLDDRMEGELEEICSRYGMVVIGYAGRDAAIARALKQTSPRFGLYWVARRAPTNSESDAIIAAASGHLIVRDGASTFLADLTRRIDAIEEHPTGVTPASLRADIIERLRAHDAVGVRELPRGEQVAFERVWDDALKHAFDATKARRSTRMRSALLSA